MKHGKVSLLVCKCADCPSWEIAKDKIICKTCGAGVDVKINVPDHEKLAWKHHDR